ncbi:MAG: hypothetical protein LUG90_15410 [Clostridiaceae bacterium]|nr:hypothetical protein [Clostridiaceae bacterium]
MSKYNSLWEYVQKNGNPSFKLPFDEIAGIAGIAIDHSFLKYKKELTEYGNEIATENRITHILWVMERAKIICAKSS